MKIISILFLVAFFVSSCSGQVRERGKTKKIVGGPCEDCEAALDYQKLDLQLSTIDTVEGYQSFEKKIEITGTVFKSDGKTPAKNVILYFYQTNRNGIYEPSENPVGWERRHGKYRGWVKTESDGKFSYYSFRPAAYPDGRDPQHIHLYIVEPYKKPYYLDNYLFDDDPMLIQKERDGLQNRGGSGIVVLKVGHGILTAKRDIILGLNIPNYE
ncbi:intradiol ring-cleavage dioxygenase [Maribacter algarum]|uniref:Intradiol ring-cleavage dioxygenase n=1 Tax=Maribacter algarum (ex Zhang et al. 2020) TaxID=2578118 RepID=A0A5S3PUM5_9FLAO|nr:intradiol ring-cleavage dioxygenase [Maribacter algarum]TMM57892.1 intradiol ring-cleavage dioxygenase [Maribacter algarum]